MVVLSEIEPVKTARQAIYAGSFDPITFGHLDVIDRALRMVDHLIVAVTANYEKSGLFSVQERIELITGSLKNQSNISCQSFDGLLVDFAIEKGVFTIVRGLRAVSDFDYEFQMALTNRRLNDQLDTIFLMTDQEYSFLSSRLVRQVASFGSDVSQFVPPIVCKALKEKFLR